MPDEPNRNLDEQLTAWARKRREEAGAPLALHPATRKLFQDEVARTFPKKSNEPEAEPVAWWKMFWPRFALAGSICVALVAVVGILLPGLAKSKSKGQQLASVRQQEKDLSADSARRDAPAQLAPDSSPSLSVEARVRHLGDEAGKSVAEKQPPAAPSLAEKKLPEQEAQVRAEVNEVRLKAGQPAKREAQSTPEQGGPVILSNTAQAPTPAGTTAPTRELYAEKERDQVFLRQRYALGAAQAGAVTSATNPPASDPKAPATAATPPPAAPQLAFDGANVEQRAGSVGARGFGGGTASNPPGANLVLNSPQNRAKADDRSLALTRSSRVATGNVDSLAAQRAAVRPATGNVYSYYAQTPASSASQRFAQVREHRVNLNSPPMPNVLSAFQLVQNGRQIRVVDADGSIYDGAIEPPPTEEAVRRGIARPTSATELKKSVDSETKRVESVSAATAGEVLAAQNVFFRVAGTNRTLNQLVVFEGNFLTASNQASEIVVGAKLIADQSAAAVGRQSLPQQAQQTSSGLIRGQATIGPNNRIEINAAPVSE